MEPDFTSFAMWLLYMAPSIGGAIVAGGVAAAVLWILEGEE
ncbi:MAG: hypothetical protein ACRCXM_04350 [Beijerinckiaceae bacterium]